MEIAWDLLKLLTTNIVNGSYKQYWSNILLNIEYASKTPKQFQKRLCNSKNITGCSVCARGGMILSQIRLGNSIHPKYDFTIEEGNSTIMKGFKITTFKIMEKEYEYSAYGHPYCNNTDEKLANMCCNILVNGNFNTKDKTDYLMP